MVKKISIVHIHTDVKFIHNVSKFDGENFKNTTVIIGSRGKYKGVYKDSVQYYNYSRKDFWKIINLCKTVNMVILYDLNFPKAYVANRLPESVIVVWRFFGRELYFRIPEYAYSEETLKVLRQKEEQSAYLKLKQRIRDYLVLIKYGTIPTSEIRKATFSRADFFLGLSKPEYEFLKNIWQNLPPFIQLNLPPYLETNTFKRTKSNLVILGNNRRPYNNHLDIIEGIRKSESKSNFKFLLMFNYGLSNNYSNIVRQEALKVKEINVLESFLPLNEFKEIYTTADAFVMNGQRQMAMGNILEALQQNIKIYLNEKNLIYSWLKENGIVVFTIENFFSDLESNNIALSLEDAIFNQQQLMKLTSKYNIDSFQKAISEIVCNWGN